MKKILFFIIGFIVFMASVNAQNLRVPERIKAISPDSFITEELFSIKEITPEKATSLGEYVSDFSLLETDDFVLNKIVANKPPALEVDLPFNGYIITLQLITSNVVNERTVFFTRNSSGKTPVNYNQGAYYYGMIKNQPNTLVAISFFNNNVIGIIADDKGNHVLGKSDKSDYDSNEYILYNDKDLLIASDIECLTDDESADMFIIPEQQQMMVACDIEVGIYIETDHQVYLNQGSNVGNVLNFVTGLFNVTTTLYQNESIDVAISETDVWTVPDPYIGALDTFAALDSFGNEMLATGFNGDLAHLFSARNIGGGRAWINVLCSSDNLRTGVSGNLANATAAFPLFSYNAFIVTHEIGHNLGSRHTHDCVWNGNDTAIDGCGPASGNPPPVGLDGCPPAAVPPGGGTIMSYCNLLGVGVDFNLGFGPQPGNLIRDRVNNAACLAAGCCDTDVVITGNNYNTALTESDTWIVSSGQTTILNTADVRLDADPVSGYIEFEPVAGADFFLAEPIGNGVFVAEALDGCEVLTPAKMENVNDVFVGNDIKNTKENTVENTIPEGFLLAQNIPNPFSETTTIKASIPDWVMNAEIVVYSLQGIEVASYPLNKKGTVAVEISAGKLAAGVYFYTLIADGRNIDTKKMILTK